MTAWTPADRLRAVPLRAIGAAPLRAVAAVLFGLCGILAGPAPASGAPAGYVRLAHLSPDTPAVDVYLDRPAGTDRPRVFPAVGYGTLSDYLPLPVGRYVVAMRPAGAPAGDPPVLTTEVMGDAGRAYTVAGVGRYADLGLRVLTDDLAAPADGRARVRVVQASIRAPMLDVTVDDGPVLAQGVPFATTTAYVEVAPGTLRLRLRAEGSAPTTADVRLTAGRVHSLLVLDGASTGLTTRLVVDAPGATPATGADDTAPPSTVAVPGGSAATDPTDRAAADRPGPTGGDGMSRLLLPAVGLLVVVGLVVAFAARRRAGRPG